MPYWTASHDCVAAEIFLINNVKFVGICGMFGVENSKQKTYRTNGELEDFDSLRVRECTLI